MNINFKYLMVAVVASMFATSCNDTILYKDPTAPVEKRADDLLKRMTLEEKVAQLKGIWNNRLNLYDENAQIDSAKWNAAFGNGLGFWERVGEDKSSMINMFRTVTSREVVENYNEIQRYFVENTRLGIPVAVHEEGVHGLLSGEATNFPQPIGIASSWDEELINEIYTVVAREGRAKGAHILLGPVMDITRDPRWGRTEETMGEEPYLNGRLGSAMIKACQGENTQDGIDQDHVAVTLKHFGVHGQSEGGSNTAPSFVDKLYAYETFFRPFRMAFETANPYNVMICYTELWGKPSHSNPELMREALRENLGYKGLVVADYGGVEDALNIGMVETPKEAAYLSFTSGLDVELPEGATFDNLVELVREGRIKESLIDQSVRRVLVEKFKLGLFDNPYLDPDKVDAIVGCDEHRQVAYKAAAESMVLLQNRDNVLPFDKSKVKTIAVIGPNATEAHLGGYSGNPRQKVSVLDAIKERYGDSMRILYAQGCMSIYKPAIDANQEGFDAALPSFVYDYMLDRNIEAPEAMSKPLIEEAVRIAKQADAVILCLGSNENIAREGTGSNLPGDVPSLELMGGQNELAQRIGALGKPTCALIITGSTNNVAKVAEAVPSVIQCWYAGQESGYAYVDAVFGDINPSGKLTISIPRDAGHVPAYYSYKRSSRRGYTLGRQISPLYPFGYGLSYTTFEYSNVRLSSSEMKADGSVEALVDVKNTGNVAGDEIVQMYIKDDISSVSRPVKELRGFRRVHLEPGQTQTVSMTIDRSSLEFYNEDLKLVVEPGTFTVMVGSSSDDNESVVLTVL